jgi:hypothetical protein
MADGPLLSTSDSLRDLVAFTAKSDAGALWMARVFRLVLRFATKAPPGFSALALRMLETADNDIQEEDHVRIIELVMSEDRSSNDHGGITLMSKLPNSLYTRYALSVVMGDLDVDRTLDMVYAARGTNPHPWMNRIMRLLQRAMFHETGKVIDEDDKPHMEGGVVCPLSLEVMHDPVISPSGISYEREWIERWLKDHETDPTTRLPLSQEDLVENRNLKHCISMMYDVKSK